MVYNANALSRWKKEFESPFSFPFQILPRVDDLGNPLNGEAASDFEEDLDPVDEEEHDHHEHQRGVAAVEDVAVELVVLAINSWGYPRERYDLSIITRKDFIHLFFHLVLNPEE